MHLAPHMCKTVTVKANAQEIITWKCIWHHICTKLLLWRQMLRKSSLENAFDTTYVQNCYFKGKFTPLPPVSHFHNNYSLHFSDFQLYQVTLPIDPPENGNFILLLTCSGQVWQFHMTSDISWSKMAISCVYWHLVPRNGNCTCLQDI